MAKATGYICDECEKFDTTSDAQAPIGWLRLTVRTIGGNPSDGFDLCSNKCLVGFGRKRHQAEKGDEPKKASAAPSKPANTNPTSKAVEDGLTTVPGLLDRYLRGDAATLRQAWYGTYSGGYEQVNGRGYTWIVDFTEGERTEFTSYLASLSTVIKKSIVAANRSQTTEERRLLATIKGAVEVLSEDAA